jgi:DNA-binding transcriptional LysR family regulator
MHSKPLFDESRLMYKYRALDLRKLDHALVLARCGSYVRASEELHITQSALTRSIQALEAQYQVRLFDRSRGGVQPTQSGRLLLQRAERIVQAARGLDSDLRQLHVSGWGRVAFGLGPLAGRAVLSTLLVDMAQAHPGVAVHAEVNGAPYLLEHLRDERLEFAVFAAGQLPDGDHPYATRPLASLPLAHVVRHGHPLAGTRGARQRLQAFAHITGTPTDAAQAPAFSMMCDDWEALRQVTLSTDAIWWTSPFAVRDDVAAGRLTVLDTKPQDGRVDLVLVHLADRSLSPGATLVIGKIEQRLGEVDTTSA